MKNRKNEENFDIKESKCINNTESITSSTDEKKKTVKSSLIDENNKESSTREPFRPWLVEKIDQASPEKWKKI